MQFIIGILVIILLVVIVLQFVWGTSGGPQRSSPGPSSCPYSPSCLESRKISEVRVRNLVAQELLEEQKTG